jgi:GTP-binding protein Era
MDDFRSGFVSVIGRPNVGKSTLINTLLRQKIAVVSPRPQTTRRTQLGILTIKGAQIVFVDTPGLHTPRHKLGEALNLAAEETLEGVDVILWIVDASDEPKDEDRQIASLLMRLKHPPILILGLNKIDRISEEVLAKRRAAFTELLPSAQAVLSFSATRGDGCAKLLAALSAHLPVRPPDYPEEQVTDLRERDLVADLIREAALIYLRDEVPHSLAVRVDEFTERGQAGAYIAATIFVERDSQKGIVIGQDARMLKKIGSTARKEIEVMSGRKVFLQLRVKVLKEWRNDETALKRLGYIIRRK